MPMLLLDCTTKGKCNCSKVRGTSVHRMVSHSRQEKIVFSAQSDSYCSSVNGIDISLLRSIDIDAKLDLQDYSSQSVHHNRKHQCNLLDCRLQTHIDEVSEGLLKYRDN